METNQHSYTKGIVAAVICTIIGFFLTSFLFSYWAMMLFASGESGARVSFGFFVPYVIGGLALIGLLAIPIYFFLKTPKPKTAVALFMAIFLIGIPTFIVLEFMPVSGIGANTLKNQDAVYTKFGLAVVGKWSGRFGDKDLILDFSPSGNGGAYYGEVAIYNAGDQKPFVTEMAVFGGDGGGIEIGVNQRYPLFSYRGFIKQLSLNSMELTKDPTYAMNNDASWAQSIVLTRVQN